MLAVGWQAWEAATDAGRKHLLSKKFIQAPLYISKLCFHFGDNVVDFEGIWGKGFGEGQEEQRECHILPALCDGREPVRTPILYANYNKAKKAPGLRALDLGKVEDVPTRPGRSQDGRRQAAFLGLPEIEPYHYDAAVAEAEEER
ncbi:uncharacterized protein LTR77_003400 [Saxophila tyrrhenica]|uniref:Uncharacterized protein n=1 Tax=Saxophila tyrrhenica TaxID=1690608 RepID=A0AAV9PGY0_9PEZI|nr:hypothetical protein LTR77_003400 [Saxophila tyrrhenica]